MSSKPFTTFLPIKIELSEQEAELFKQFMQHHDVFQKLLDGKVFEVRGSHVKIHFNTEGQLRRIETYFETGVFDR